MDEILRMKNKIHLFDGIDAAELASMLKCLSVNKKHIKKNTYLFMEEDEIHSIGVILSGTIHMIKEDSLGNKTLITPMTEGDIFGETYICSSRLTSTVSFQAATNCNILFLPFQKVIKTCSSSCTHHHKLIENMMLLLAEKNLKLIKKVEVTSNKSIREKILSYLANQTPNKDMQIVIPFNRIELADYLCVNRSALTRELSKMRSEGIIDYEKNIFYLKLQKYKDNSSKQAKPIII